MSALPSDHRVLSCAYKQAPNDPQFKVFVLYTGLRRTRVALRAAARLAAGLDAGIEIVFPQVVPYPLPIDQPPVYWSFWTNRFQTLLEEAEVETRLQVCLYLCRDRRKAMASALPPDSIVVIGDRNSWWRRREYRLGRWLRANGYQVLFVDRQSFVKEFSHA